MSETRPRWVNTNAAARIVSCHPEVLRLYDRRAAVLVQEYGFRRHLPAEFSTGDAEECLAVVAEGHGRAAMLNARSMLSGMFRFAVRKGALSVNPVREAEVPHNWPAEVRPADRASLSGPRAFPIRPLATWLNGIRFAACWRAPQRLPRRAS
ncbi:hypothetical protein ABZ412_09685 [Nocardia sp. NPDC005746]|uniref:hypothetical protein n=1 Tax=Nocardia sp. NPDC005746 TaxID=3157062 RepID=UPI0033FA858D